MVNTYNELVARNKSLLNEIELLKKQLADKQSTEITEQEEIEFKQEASERVNQMMEDVVRRFLDTKKRAEVERDLKTLISGDLRSQFITAAYQQDLINNYTNEKLEKESENFRSSCRRNYWNLLETVWIL